MTMLEAIQSVFSNYANFNGRARRSEYWYFTLFNLIVSFILSMITVWIDSKIPLYIWQIALILPCIAVAIRRLHDTGRSGWFYLLVLIPLVGSIILIVFYCQDGQHGMNKYGPDPKNPGGFDYGGDLYQGPTM